MNSGTTNWDWKKHWKEGRDGTHDYAIPFTGVTISISQSIFEKMDQMTHKEREVFVSELLDQAVSRVEDKIIWELKGYTSSLDKSP